jgi:hypothetical protein
MTRTQSRLTVAAVVAVLGAGLIVAGCGSSSKDDYKKQVTNAAKQFQTDAQKAGQALSASHSPTQVKAAAGQFKTAVSTFTDKLSSLDPPGDAKDEQDKLVTDLKSFSGTVDQVSNEVAKASSGGNASGLTALLPKLQSDVQNVQTDAQNLQNAVNES